MRAACCKSACTVATVVVLSLAAVLPSILHAQNGWLPPSREMERPYATQVQRTSNDLHSAIRPWRLKEIKAATTDTLPSFIPLLDRAADTSHTIRWGPLIDANGGLDAEGGGAFFRAGAGLWADADAGRHLNFHFDGQVWSESFPRYLDNFIYSTQVTPGEGFAYGSGPNYVHYDVNGHVSWDPSRFFNLTLGRGKNSFGEGYRSLFLSTEAQGYPFLRITTTVWKVKYVNLFMMLNDMRGINGDPLKARRKYAAMHYLSWNATRNLNVAVFEAIVFDPGTDQYPRGFDLNYLDPVIFYRPVEFNQGSPDNALLGGSINVKASDRTMFYSQFLLDEFVWYHVRNGTGWYGNKQSVQLGMIARNAFRVQGLSLRAEWNYIRPFMYTHINNVQNYAHFGQPLAHPYGSNVSELVLHADLQRERWLYSFRTSMAWMAEDSLYSYGNNIFRSDNERESLPNGSRITSGYYPGQYYEVQLLQTELRAGFLLDRNSATRLEGSYILRYRTAENAPDRIGHIFRLGISTYFRDRHPEQDARYFLR